MGKKLDIKQIGKFVAAGAASAIAASMATNIVLPMLLGEDLGTRVKNNRSAKRIDTSGMNDEDKKAYAQKWSMAILAVVGALAVLAAKVLKKPEYRFGAWSGLGLPALIGLAALAGKSTDVKQYVAMLDLDNLNGDIPDVEINGAADEVIARIPASAVSDYLQSVSPAPQLQLNGPERPVAVIVPTRRTTMEEIPEVDLV